MGYLPGRSRAACFPKKQLRSVLTCVCSALVVVASFSDGFTANTRSSRSLQRHPLFSSSDDDLSSLLTSRFPTSVQDQVRQASDALRRATDDGKHRHSIRLLLPLIGATELDDWPGGARQMMEAASPLIQDILKSSGNVSIQASMLDASDGVSVLMAQAVEAKDDSCSVLLPSADTLSKLQSLEKQVGTKRNLILVNPQWKRKTDFSFFGRNEQVQFAELFEPTYFCGNLMVEGDQVRLLRSYPGPWRIFLRMEDVETQTVTWEQIGEKQVVLEKPAAWEQDLANQRDGGRLFDYGQPTYGEIEKMILSMDGYKPKTMAERAAAAFTFIKDTL